MHHLCHRFIPVNTALNAAVVPSGERIHLKSTANKVSLRQWLLRHDAPWSIEPSFGGHPHYLQPSRASGLGSIEANVP